MSKVRITVIIEPRVVSTTLPGMPRPQPRLMWFYGNIQIVDELKHHIRQAIGTVPSHDGMLYLLVKQPNGTARIVLRDNDLQYIMNNDAIVWSAAAVNGQIENSSSTATAAALSMTNSTAGAGAGAGAVVETSNSTRTVAVSSISNSAVSGPATSTGTAVGSSTVTASSNTNSTGTGTLTSNNTATAAVSMAPTSHSTGTAVSCNTAASSAVASSSSESSSAAASTSTAAATNPVSSDGRAAMSTPAASRGAVAPSNLATSRRTPSTNNMGTVVASAMNSTASEATSNSIRTTVASSVMKSGTTGAATKAKWKANFQKLVEYKNKNGHCNVPTNSSALGRWANRQRVNYRKMKENNNRTLSDEQIDQLESIGFKWEINKQPSTPRSMANYNKQFDTMKEKFLAYKQETGSGWVPSRYTKDQELGTWANRQRWLAKKGELKDERRKILDRVGFEWKRPIISGDANINSVNSNSNDDREGDVDFDVDVDVDGKIGGDNDPHGV
mmetsp:Transcript_15395/g.38211  ORF Transcript_15395/g.38211 Transcript_15395/m.38211 type:complete len:501 (+) Transcript_15395:350-1852(+)